MGSWGVFSKIYLWTKTSKNNCQQLVGFYYFCRESQASSWIWQFFFWLSSQLAPKFPSHKDRSRGFAIQCIYQSHSRRKGDVVHNAQEVAEFVSPGLQNSLVYCS